MKLAKVTSLTVVAAMLLTGCAVTPKSFYADPSGVKDTPLCRAIVEAMAQGNSQFARDTAAEADRRGLTLEQCRTKIAQEDAAIVGIALVGTAVGVAMACSNGCATGGYNAPAYVSTDYDCAGGLGDGPYFVRGPIPVGGNDPYNLDRDGDGIGCELGDYGA